MQGRRNKWSRSSYSYIYVFPKNRSNLFNLICLLHQKNNTVPTSLPLSQVCNATVSIVYNSLYTFTLALQIFRPIYPSFRVRVLCTTPVFPPWGHFFSFRAENPKGSENNIFFMKSWGFMTEICIRLCLLGMHCWF